MWKKGTNRVVLLIPRFGIVVKFAIIRPKLFLKVLFRTLFSIPLGDKNRMTAYYGLLRIFFRGETDQRFSGRWYLFKGVMDNWREFTFFQKNKRNEFLLPVFFSFFGLCNVSPIAQEVYSEFEESYWKELLNATDREILDDGHHFENCDNFGHYKGNLRMIDYGGSKVQRIISNHFEKLNELSRRFTKN